MIVLTPAPGSMLGPHGGRAENTRVPIAVLDLPLPVPVPPAAPEEVTLLDAPNLLPVSPCSRRTRFGAVRRVKRKRLQMEGHLVRISFKGYKKFQPPCPPTTSK